MSRRTLDPDWDSPLTLNVTPAGLAGALFSSADEVHTAWQSCVDPNLVVAESVAHDANTSNYCRLVEQGTKRTAARASGTTGASNCASAKSTFPAIGARHGRAARISWSNDEAQKAFWRLRALRRRVGRTVYVEEPLESGPSPTRH